MAKRIVTDEVWRAIGPVLPAEPPRPRGGRSRVDSRAALTGILFVLKSGIPWELLPREMGCGSGMTCWRRLREWQRAGVWSRVSAILSNSLTGGERIDWERAHRERNAPASRRDPARRAARANGTGYRELEIIPSVSTTAPSAAMGLGREKDLAAIK